jgi:hypothetical protein
MIDNFEQVKEQLKELATVINTFKSESVQLRIIEIVLSGRKFSDVDVALELGNKKSIKTKRISKRSKTIAAISNDTNGHMSKGKKRTSGAGAVATLLAVYQDGFFGQPRAIKDILQHCETNLARKIKANEISGKLARMVRNGELTRAKNADGQYEYKKS